MKKKILILTALLTCMIGTRAADIDQSLPSNWGGWQNLTYGVSDSTKFTNSRFNSQVEIEGQTIHLIWWEPGKDAEGLYLLYYRRSTDLGRTWDTAQVVGSSHEVSGEYQDFMAVSGNRVHILIPDNGTDNRISYARSIDGGATFTTRELASGARFGGYKCHRIACDGQTVAMAYQYATGTRPFTYDDHIDYRSVHVISSSDGGETLTDTEIAKQDIIDMKVQGSRLAVMGDSLGKMLITTSANSGMSYTTKNIAHVTPNGNSYVQLWTHNFNYSHMSMDGQNINVIYRGSLSDGGEGEPNPGDDLMHTIFQRSTDGGETWQEPMYIEGTCGIEPNIIASKGNYIYVLTCAGTGRDARTGRDAHPTIFYSHDGGTTWAKQRRCFDTYEASIGNFTIVPDDPTGKHVIFTAQQGFYMETKDGFETVYRNFRLGDQSWEPRRDWNNETLTVLFDQEGTEHWFMQYSPYKAGLATGDPYFWNICHRRVERPAESGDKNMAYHLTKTTANSAITDIIVPMSPSIEATSEAITVEAWVRFDAASGTFLLASQNNNSASLGGSNSWDGWYIELYYQAGGATPGGFSFNGCVHTTSGGGLFQPWTYLIREMGQWHHVAMTYDSNLKENNLHFYIDGLPYRTATDLGKIKMGNNPILIGRTGSQADGDVLIDNFAIYSRALTLDEIHQHIYGKPDANDKDCRLLLTFDGTLRDQSQYHNDPVPLMNNPLEEHDGINTPKPDFTLTKDTKGTTVYVNDITPDGEVYWWFKPSPTTLGAYNESSKKHESVNYSGHSGNYTFWMVAKGNGEETNAFAPVAKQFTISGLSKAFPSVVGKADGVRVKVQGGYRVTYSSKPKVLLHKGTTDIEGQWLVKRGYDSQNAKTVDDLPDILFDLSQAETGKYDVVVGTDTLKNGFEVTEPEEMEVWAQVNGPQRFLQNKRTVFTIDYGNKSNVPAYNVPVTIYVSANAEVELGFDVEKYDPALDDEEVIELIKNSNDYASVVNEKGDSMRCYTYVIPYIPPKSTKRKSMVVTKQAPTEEDIDQDEIDSDDQHKEEHIQKLLDDLREFYIRLIIESRKKPPVKPVEPVDLWSPLKEYAEALYAEMAQKWVEWDYLHIFPPESCAYQGLQWLSIKMDEGDDVWEAFLTGFVPNAMRCAEFKFKVETAKISERIQDYLAEWMLKIYAAGNTLSEYLKPHYEKKQFRCVASFDPNEMFGPAGYDDEKHFIQPIGNMAYTVTFENKATASAPANEVFVTDTLDLSKLDAETFSFSSFGWADTTFVVGGSQTQEFTRDVIYKVNDHETLVRVSGEFNPATGVVNWSFVSLEKNGNELNDVMNGFLQPNDDNGRGEGYVSFMIEHKPNPASGSTVSNKATIIFDANEPIVTNTYVNTFDTDYPTSKITSITEDDGFLHINFEGSDKTSGIDHYDFFIFVEGTDDYIAVRNITQTTVPMPCEPGTKYGFCVIATDRVGHVEAKDVKAEKQFTTSGNAPTPTTYALNVSEAGYATFYDAENNYELPAGLKASVVSGTQGGRLTYQALSGNVIPKGTAVLIEATLKKAATYTLTATVADGSAVSTNLLYGSNETTTTSAPGTNRYYKLAYGPSNTSLATSFGWFWGAQNGAPFRIDGHRAWLAVPTGAAARGYLISGEETDIEGIAGDDAMQQAQQYVDLQGRRIEKPVQPGIYFLNGRKVVIK